MSKSVIVAGARTPIGKLSGALGGFTAMQLGGFAIAAALERAGVAPEDVDAVLMGQVLQAGQGQMTARQAAVAAGIPMTVHATTINKVCLSGLNTIYLADLLVRAGEAEVVVAGGMESMTQAPHLLKGARAGYRLGAAISLQCEKAPSLLPARKVLKAEERIRHERRIKMLEVSGPWLCLGERARKKERLLQRARGLGKARVACDLSPTDEAK